MEIYDVYKNFARSINIKRAPVEKVIKSMRPRQRTKHLSLALSPCCWANAIDAPTCTHRHTHRVTCTHHTGILHKVIHSEKVIYAIFDGIQIEPKPKLYRTYGTPPPLLVIVPRKLFFRFRCWCWRFFNLPLPLTVLLGSVPTLTLCVCVCVHKWLCTIADAINQVSLENLPKKIETKCREKMCRARGKSNL